MLLLLISSARFGMKDAELLISESLFCCGAFVVVLLSSFVNDNVFNGTSFLWGAFWTKKPGSNYKPLFPCNLSLFLILEKDVRFPHLWSKVQPLDGQDSNEHKKAGCCCFVCLYLCHQAVKNEFLGGMKMLWLSKERNCCRFHCATFRLPWVRSLRCPSKEFISKKRKKFLDGYCVHWNER